MKAEKMNHLNMQDYILMIQCRCGQMQKIHLKFKNSKVNILFSLDIHSAKYWYLLCNLSSTINGFHYYHFFISLWAVKKSTASETASDIPQ